MIITSPGKYRILSNFKTSGSISIAELTAGSIIKITQVDTACHKVIGPAFLDWEYWDLPVEEVADADPK